MSLYLHQLYVAIFFLTFRFTGLQSPRNFRHTQLEKYGVIFLWEDPMLPDIRLTSYVIFYNVTNAFNQQLNDSIHLSPDDNIYAFNKTCSYETGLALCPSSQYCFVLRGVYIRNGVASLTIPSDTICFDTPEYRKRKCYKTLYILPCCMSIIALLVSLMEIKYNITEGTKLDIKMVASRPFSMDFNVHIIPTLITATGEFFTNSNISNC